MYTGYWIPIQTRAVCSGGAGGGGGGAVAPARKTKFFFANIVLQTPF